MKKAARDTRSAYEGVRKRPRSRKKDILAALIIILLLAFVISGTKIQSVDEYYLTHIDDITPQSATVTLSIECKTVLENLSVLDPALKAGDFVPEDGEPVCAAQAFEPTLEGDLLTVRVTDETGHVSTVYIARRCAQ